MATSKRRQKLEEKVAGSPRRPDERHYQGSTLGYGVDEVSGLRDLGGQLDEAAERDDEQLLTAQLTEAGVDRVFGGRRRRDTLADDLNEEAFHENERLLSGEDPMTESQLEIEDAEDGRFIATQPPLKARRTL